MSRKRKRRPKGPPKPNNRPKKYRKWDDESMSGAIKSVMDGKMGINRAADQYGVPRTTLKDRLSGRVVQGTNPGPIPYLSASEEYELFQHLLTCAEIGYPKTKCQVIGIVRQAVQKKRGADAAKNFTGKGWWNRFLERWPKLCLRKGDALAISRAKAVTASNVAQYYDLLKKTLEEHGLMGCPNRTYNMDESGMPLDHKLPKVVAQKGVMWKMDAHPMPGY